MEIKHIEIRLARATTLPIFPHVVQEVIGLSDNPNAGSRDYERVICHDAALVAKIIRTANAPYFGGSGNIGTLQRAVTQLGVNTVRSICLTAAFKSSLSSAKTNKRFVPRTFWQHSFAVACTCKLLACLAGRGMQEEAFIAGLMHDIGKLAAARFLNTEMDAVYKQMDVHKISQYEAEMQCWELSHQEIGGAVVRLWGLPSDYVSPITRHHTPTTEGAEIDRLTAYVHIANALVHHIGIDHGGGSASSVDADQDVLDYVALGPQMYDRISNVIATEVARLSESMGI